MAEPRTLTEEECWRLLEKHVVGRVGFDLGRGLRIHPINYAVDQRTVLLRTDRASELARFVELFSDGGTVAFEIDLVDHDTHAGWSVLVGGRASEVPTDGEHDGVPAGSAPRPWVSGPRDLLVRVTPVEVTGRRIGE